MLEVLRLLKEGAIMLDQLYWRWKTLKSLHKGSQPAPTAGVVSMLNLQGEIAWGRARKALDILYPENEKPSDLQRCVRLAGMMKHECKHMFTIHQKTFRRISDTFGN